MGWSSTGIEVYYTPSSAHCRALLMCIKALELDVELIKIDMYQKFEHRRPWFIKMNPQHTVPTINDNGFILWESKAIMCYLVNKYGQSSTQHLYPQDPEQRAKVDRILYFDIGTLYKSIVDYFHPVLMSEADPDHTKENALKTSLDFLDGFLAEQTFIIGDFVTIADFSILSSITQLEAMGYKITSYRNVHKWMENLKTKLTFYNECNDAGLEMFRNWTMTKSKQKTSSTSTTTNTTITSRFGSKTSI